MIKFRNILFVGVMLLMAQLAIQAQITTGSIAGTVTDAAGALVPGATITVAGQSGEKYTATTNAEGYFSIQAVQAGSLLYKLTISAASFKTTVVENVKVNVATPSTVN